MATARRDFVRLLAGTAAAGMSLPLASCAGETPTLQGALDSVVEEVNRLLRQYAEMRRLVRRFGKGQDPRKVLRSLGL